MIILKLVYIKEPLDIHIRTIHYSVSFSSFSFDICEKEKLIRIRENIQRLLPNFKTTFFGGSLTFKGTFKADKKRKKIVYSISLLVKQFKEVSHFDTNHSELH